MSDIKVGDEVICVDGRTLPEQYLGVEEGEIYRVKWVGMCRTYLGGDYAGIRLAGVKSWRLPAVRRGGSTLCSASVQAGG